MSRRVVIFAFLIVAMFAGLPISGAASATVKDTSLTPGSDPQISITVGQPRRRYRRGFWRNGRFYRNYGQYRREQVGWRRYRIVPRYYWRDGRRYTTYRRVYYY